MATSRRAFLAASLPLAGAAAALTIPVVVKAAEPITPIQAAFGRWVEHQTLVARSLSILTDDELSQEMERAETIVEQIATMSATTPTDWAVKSFLYLHGMYGGRRGRVLEVNLPGDLGPDADLERSIYADALRFVEPYTLTA